MSVAENLSSETNVVLTSKAMDLLGCYQGDLDELVAQMAEDCARKRYSEAGSRVDVIEINESDVITAGVKLAEWVKKLAVEGLISQLAANAVHKMGECVECNQ